MIGYLLPLAAPLNFKLKHVVRTNAITPQTLDSVKISRKTLSFVHFSKILNKTTEFVVNFTIFVNSEIQHVPILTCNLTNWSKN